MPKLARHIAPTLLGALCAAGVAAAGPPASAQGSADEFTVIGRAERPFEHSLTAVVSYRDLDLTTSDGRAALRRRLWRTAEKLCARLGESHLGGVAGARSCEDQALYDAAVQQRAVRMRDMSPAYAGAPDTAPRSLTMRVVAAK